MSLIPNMAIKRNLMLASMGYDVHAASIVIKPHLAAPQCCLNPLLITDNGKKDS
jgi:hypothetical protein